MDDLEECPWFFFRIFREINRPACWGIPHLWKPPKKYFDGMGHAEGKTQEIPRMEWVKTR